MLPLWTAFVKLSDLAKGSDVSASRNRLLLWFQESSVGLPAPCRVWRSFVFCLLSSSLACFVHLTTNGYFCSVGFVSLGFLRMRFSAPCPTLLLSHSGGLGTDIGGVISSRKQSKLKCWPEKLQCCLNRNDYIQEIINVWDLVSQVVHLVTSEFFQQGDLERSTLKMEPSVSKKHITYFICWHVVCQQSRLFWAIYIVFCTSSPIFNVNWSLLWMPSLVKSATIIFSKLYALLKKQSKRFVKIQAVSQFSGESKAKINYRIRYFHH